MQKDDVFPKVKKSIENYLTDEEGNITRNKVVLMGTLAIVMSLVYGVDVFAKHSSHRSHSSHSSHSSSAGEHYSHQSHQSHQSHVSSVASRHASHSSASITLPSSAAVTSSPGVPVIANPAAGNTNVTTAGKMTDVPKAAAAAGAVASLPSNGQAVYTNSQLGMITEGTIIETALNGSQLTENIQTIQALAAGSTDWSCIYIESYYLIANPDIAQAFGTDSVAIFQHFLNYGMSEGRIASPEFNVSTYMAYYPDLVAAFGNDIKSYYLHYMNYGKAEGRIGY